MTRETTYSPIQKLHSRRSTEFNRNSTIEFLDHTTTESSTELVKSKKNYAQNQNSTTSLCRNCSNTHDDSYMEFNKTSVNQVPNDTEHWTPNDTEPWTPNDTEQWTPNDTEQWTPNDTEQWTPNDTEQWTPNDTEPWTPNDTEQWTPNDTEQWTPNDMEQLTPLPRSFNTTNKINETTSTFNSSQDVLENPDISSILTVFSSAAIFVGFVVVLLNSLVIIVFARNRGLRHNNHYNLVMGLSFSDFLMGLSALITGFRLSFSILTSLISLCIVMNLFCAASLILSVYQIFCISLNRFLVLSESPWAKILFDGNRKYCICIAGWVSIFTLFCSLISPEGDQTICLYASVFGKFVQVVRWTTCFLLLFFLFLTILFYFLAILEVKRRYTNLSSIASREIDAKKKERVMKSMKLVGMILLALFLFSSPLVFTTFYGNVPALHLGAFAAANVNSLINPFLYCSRIKNIRTEILSMACCKSKSPSNVV